MSRHKHKPDELVSELRLLWNKRLQELATEFRTAMTKHKLWEGRRNDYDEAVLEALMQNRGLTRKQAIRSIGEDDIDDEGGLIPSKFPEQVRVAAKKATAKKYKVAPRTVERWLEEGPGRRASLRAEAAKLRRALEEEGAPGHPLIDEFKALEDALPARESRGDWHLVAMQEPPMGRGVLWRKTLLQLATRRVTLSRQLERTARRQASRIEELEAEIKKLRTDLREQDIKSAAAATGARSERGR